MNSKKSKWILSSLVSVSLLTSVAIGADSKFCQQYAKKAISQFNQAKANKLPGINPPVWSNNYQGHKFWCELPTITKAIANDGTAMRQKHLDTYLKADLSKNVKPRGFQTVTIPKQAPAATPITIPKPTRAATPVPIPKPIRAPVATPITIPKPIPAITPVVIPKQTPRLKPIAMPKPGQTVRPIKLTYNKALHLKLKNMFKNAQVFDTQNALQFMLLDADASNPLSQSLSAIDSPMFNVNVLGTSSVSRAYIGSGYDTLRGSLKIDSALKSLKPYNVDQGGAELSSSSGYVSNNEEYQKNIAVSASASASYGLFSGSFSGKIEKDSSYNKYSRDYVAESTYRTLYKYPEEANLQLTDEAVEVLKTGGQNEFYRRYGDTFIFGIQYGAGFKGRGTYKFHNSNERRHVSANASGGGWGVTVNTSTEKDTIKKKESEVRDIGFYTYGYHPQKNPGSINMLREEYENFPREAAKMARDHHSGTIIYYTVVKYSSLPEFQRIAGLKNTMDMRLARTYFDELVFYDRKLQRMINNLQYVVLKPSEFKKDAVKKSRRALSQANILQQRLKGDIKRVQSKPFDKTYNINLNQYRNMPAYAPSTMLVHVTVEIPGTGDDGYWSKWEGPMIGNWPCCGIGDNEFNSRCCIDVEIKSELLIVGNSSTVILQQFLSVQENKDDVSWAFGTNLLPVYEVPEGYTIKGFKKHKSSYSLQNLRGKGGSPHKDIRVKNEDIWKKLTVIIDGKGDKDSHHIGLYGTLNFYVEIQENSWLEGTGGIL